jgi:HJR/Mrr/RecB family endonuclease
MQKPELSDFGISQADVDWAADIERRLTNAVPIVSAIGWAIYGLRTLATSDSISLGIALLLVIFVGPALVLFTSMVALIPVTAMPPLFSDRIRSVNKYQSARKAFRAWWARTQREFWLSLSGTQFEAELAALYSRLGHRAELTARSGDEGVDIWLYTERGKEIVQCKAHGSPIGPATARELFGTIEHFKAPAGILASTSGFTKGVVKYVEGKPIKLIGLKEILALQEKCDSV